MASLKGKIILVLFGIFISLLFGEAALRFSGYSSGIYVFDQKTGMSILRPNKTFYWTKECFKNKVRANSAGFNAGEFVEEKGSGVFRIVVLGDSYVEALQVPQEKTFYYLLEGKLNQEFSGSGKKIEVYSLGHSGNGTLMNYFYLKNYGLKYRPDLVIDSFLVGNDFRDDDYELTKEYAKQTGDATVLSTKPFPVLGKKGQIDFVATEGFFKDSSSSQKSLLRAVFSKSSLATWLYHKYLEVRISLSQKSPASPLKELKTGDIPLDNQVYLTNYSDEWNLAWESEKKLLGAVNSLSKENGAKFMAVSLTEAMRIHPDEKINAVYGDTKVFDLDKPEKLLSDISREEGFSYLPLVPIFRERFKKEGNQTTFSCDGHWNEVGHAWAADAIFEYLKFNSGLLNIE